MFPDSEVIARIESRLEPRWTNHFKDCPSDEDIMADCECEKIEKDRKYDAAEAKYDAEKEW